MYALIPVYILTYSLWKSCIQQSPKLSGLCKPSMICNFPFCPIYVCLYNIIYLYILIHFCEFFEWKIKICDFKVIHFINKNMNLFVIFMILNKKKVCICLKGDDASYNRSSTPPCTRLLNRADLRMRMEQNLHGPTSLYFLGP
jgi:hypothetical protein